MSYTFTCDNCEEEFTRSWKGGELKFCSRQCSGEYHRKDRIITHCDNCGEEIRKPKNEVRDHNFCNTECRNEWQTKQGNTEICEWCGEEFHIPPKENKEHNFCCHEHYAKWLSENQTGEDHPNYSKETVRCSYCGKEIERPKWHREQATNHFCDRECYSDYLKNGKVLTNCTNCGKRIILSRFRYLQSEDNFCSMDCYNKWHRGENCYNWKGGISSQYRGPNWEQRREKVIERDNNTCQICDASGEDVKLDVHHKIPFQDFEREGINKDKDITERIDYKEANKLDNLILLCDSCHRKAEEGVISIDK